MNDIEIKKEKVKLSNKRYRDKQNAIIKQFKELSSEDNSVKINESQEEKPIFFLKDAMKEKPTFTPKAPTTKAIPALDQHSTISKLKDQMILQGGMLVIPIVLKVSYQIISAIIQKYSLKEQKQGSEKGSQPNSYEPLNYMF